MTPDEWARRNRSYTANTGWPGQREPSLTPYIIAPVRAVIQEEERRIMVAAEVDAVWVIQRLKENAARAIEAGDLSVVNRALELIGKQIGMFVERANINLGFDEVVFYWPYGEPGSRFWADPEVVTAAVTAVRAG